jgi:hypothetical protein
MPPRKRKPSAASRSTRAAGINSETFKTLGDMKIKNEKKAMQMFCSEDTYLRKQLTRPFINSVYDGKVIATDGYVLLIVDKKLLRCKYETDSLKIPHQGYKPISIPISFAAIVDAYNLLE